MILFMNIYMKAMKNNIPDYNSKSRHLKFFSFLAMLAFLFNYSTAISQTKKPSSAKHTFNIRMNYISSNGLRSVSITLSKYEEGKALPVENLKSPVFLYLNEVKDYDSKDGTGRISKAYVNKEGEGTFKFPKNFDSATSNLHTYKFIAKMESDSIYENAEKEIEILDAKVLLEYSVVDSISSATAYLLEWKDNRYVAVPEVELKLCFKRAFNFLQFGDNGASTDENGKITGILPLDVPGNIDHTITVAARVEDHETYGTIEVTKKVAWAVLPRVNPIRGRTLWSPGDNAPLLLVISSVTIIVCIWGTIIYLVYLLVKVKIIGNEP